MVPGQQKPQGWPTYVPPAGSPRTGWSTPPGATPPQWQPGSGPSYGGPPRRNVGLLVAGIVLALALVAGIGVAGWLLLRDDSGDSTTAADPSASATPSPSVSAASPSATPPSASAPAPPAVSSPAPPRRTRSSKPHVDSNPNKLTASDFPGDWDFSLGGTQLSAKYKFSHDYTTCDDIGSQKLVDAGCRYAVQWAYTALGGKLVMTQVMYVMGSEKEATSAAKEVTQDDFNLPQGSELANFDTGKWIAKASTKVVVVSLVTAAKSVRKQDVEDYLHYSSADFSSALLFMSM